MNSVKNLVVIAMLMGVSYGAYQVINAPDPMASEAEIEALDIQIGDSTGAMPAAPQNNEPFITVAGGDANSLPPGTPAESSPFELPDLSSQLQSPMVTQPDPAALAINPPTTQPLDSPNLSAPNSSGFQLPTARASNNVQLPANSTAGTIDGGQFQPQPETELLPVQPKNDLADMANQLAVPKQPLEQVDFSTSEGATGSDVNQIESSLVPPLDGINEAAPANFLETGIENAPISRIERPTQTPMDILVEATPDQSNDPPSALSPVAPATGQSTMVAKSGGTEIPWDQMTELVDQGQLKQALKRLSTFYSADLPADQRMQLLQWLDLLAGRVIYSTEHQLQRQPYIVQNGETLESLAKQWKVPAQLIYNVNRSKIGDPNALVPGTELKIIQGPFHAEVNLVRNQLTLFLEGNYAGRFAVQLGQDGAIEHGNFDVVQKQIGGKDYQDALGQTIPAGNPNNPYGQYWIGLTEQMCIHDANSTAAATDTRGCIRLSNKDAADIFGILSEGSQVLIR